MPRACCWQNGLFLVCCLSNAHGPLVVTAVRDTLELENIMASNLQPEKVHHREGEGAVAGEHAVQEVAKTNVTVEGGRLGGSCCCKEEDCRGRTTANHNDLLFEYQLTGKSMCCQLRDSGFSNFGGLMSCPWYGFSKAAADAAPHISKPCTCHWQVWSRKPKFSDVRQGQLGSCYLLAELASLAHFQPQVIENMFLDSVGVPRDKLWYGSHPVFRTGWQIDGKATAVAVDSMVPMDKHNKQTFFASYNSGNDDHHTPVFWPVILEKAFAKIYGSYKAIESGWGTEAIYAITGAPAFEITRPSSASLVEKNDRWRHLKSSMQNKFPVWANSDQGVHGLSSGHAYAVLGFQEVSGGQGRHNRMLHVYNPWSVNYYDGDLEHMKQDDGSFWMTADEFWANFDHVDVAEVRPGYREISLNLGERSKSAKAVLKFRMESDRPFIVSVSKLNERFFKGTECESLANSETMRLDPQVTPRGGESSSSWTDRDSDALFRRFPGKAGDYEISVKVEYPAKNWDSRVRIYADEQDFVRQRPVLTDVQRDRDPKLDDCHAGVGNRDNLDEWRDLANGLEDVYFRPKMESIAYEGTYCGDIAHGIQKKCDAFNTWGSFVDAAC